MDQVSRDPINDIKIICMSGYQLRKEWQVSIHGETAKVLQFLTRTAKSLGVDDILSEPFISNCLLSCREKQLLASGDNFGRDLTGVQKLQKKHQRFKDELDSHQGRVQVRGEGLGEGWGEIESCRVEEKAGSHLILS